MPELSAPSQLCPSCKNRMVSGEQDSKKVYACLTCNKVIGLVTIPHDTISETKKALGDKVIPQRGKSSENGVQTPKTYIIELPLPPRQLSPNASSPGNWWVKSKAAKQYRETCGMLLWAARDKGGGILFPNGCTLTYKWYMGNNRKGDGLLRVTDTDNSLLACKRVQDSLVDAAYIPDDTAKYVSIKEVKLYRKKQEHQGRCCIVLTIEPKEENK